MNIFLLQLILIWISKILVSSSCSSGNWRLKTKPALVEMAVLHCKTKGALVAAAIGANVTAFFFWQLISRKWKYEPICQFKLSVLLCILCKCNCRRSISHCKSATQFAPQKCVSLITEKFPKEEGVQWPTSMTHFAKVTYLRPPTRLFHSPTLRRLGLCCDRSKSPRGRDVEQSSPRPDWIQNRQAHPGGRSQKLPPEAEQIRVCDSSSDPHGPLIANPSGCLKSMWASHVTSRVKVCLYNEIRTHQPILFLHPPWLVSPAAILSTAMTYKLWNLTPADLT